MDNPENGPVIPLSSLPDHERAGQAHVDGPDRQESDGLRPARGYSWAPFEAGHTLSLTHGVYSPRVVSARSELVRQDVLASRPDLASDPEQQLPLALFCRAVAREELATEGIENAVAGGQPVSARLLEAASSAARVAHELGVELVLALWRRRS